jgi:hypothetical protein
MLSPMTCVETINYLFSPRGERCHHFVSKRANKINSTYFYRPFFRWRSAQVVFFDFKKSVFEGNAEKKQNVQLFLPGEYQTSCLNY